MITYNNNIKCDFCGQFVKLEHIINGEAYNHMTTPESPVSVETYESACKACVDKYGLQKHCFKSIVSDE